MSATSLRAMPAPELAPRLSLSYEVSDLVYYLASGHTVTGIQRVQQRLCLELLGDTGATSCSFVIYDRLLRTWRSVPNQWLLSLLSAAQCFQSGEQSWNKIYEKFVAGLDDFSIKKFEPGEWLLNVGASWALVGYFAQIRHLRERGVRFATYLHDCIPVRHPAYFDYAHTIEYTYWLAQLPGIADAIICNSQATRADYLQFVQPASDRSVYVCQLDAAWQSAGLTPEAELAASELLSALDCLHDQFVLCVGTIEPRKNHLALIRVWDQLRQTHRQNCPKLLCVGRIGWKSESVLSEAKSLGLLDTYVHFVSGLSDEVLEALYRNCLFTVYLSFYEGWGLPISESLAAGKVCIAGRNSSLIEAGAGCAIHVDERSEREIHDIIARFLDDPGSLAKASVTIAHEYRPRSWGDVANQITEILGSASQVAEAPQLPLLELNRLYRFGRSEPVKAFDCLDVGEVFCTGNAWHRPEEWGIWTGREVSDLTFRIRANANRPTIFVGITAPPHGMAKATVMLNGRPLTAFGPFSGKQVIRVPLKDIALVPGGEFTPIRLSIVSDRSQDMRQIVGSSDSRTLGLGFVYIIAFDKTLMFERLEFVERVITGEV